MKASNATAYALTAAGSSTSEAGAAIDDPVPTAVHGVIDLFTTQLAKIAFPDVDAATLRRQADELRAEAAMVIRAQAALDAAIASCAARASALDDTARRAVAYAQIYSTAHPERRELAAALAALSGPAEVTAGAAAPAKRRGRPPRRSAELFDAPSAGALSDPDPL